MLSYRGRAHRQVLPAIFAGNIIFCQRKNARPGLQTEAQFPE